LKGYQERKRGGEAKLKELKVPYRRQLLLG